jgi:hypothetical protein
MPPHPEILRRPEEKERRLQDDNGGNGEINTGFRRYGIF